MVTHCNARVLPVQALLSPFRDSPVNALDVGAVSRTMGPMKRTELHTKESGAPAEPLERARRLDPETVERVAAEALKGNEVHFGDDGALLILPKLEEK